jgi:hypothetical protein
MPERFAPTMQLQAGALLKHDKTEMGVKNLQKNDMSTMSLQAIRICLGCVSQHHQLLGDLALKLRTYDLCHIYFFLDIFGALS